MKLIKEYILTREVFFNILIFVMWGYLLLAYFRAAIGVLPVIGNYQLEAEAVLVTLIVLAALPAVINRMATIDWLFLLGCCGIYIINIGIFHTNYDILIKNIFPTLCITIPFFVMGRLLDIKKYIKPMVIISAVCIIMDAFYFLIYMRNPEKMIERMAGEYYMYQAYRLLPHVALLFWQGMKTGNMWKLILAILGTFLIIAYGTRGPLACLGTFCITYFFLYTKFRYSIWIKSIIIALCAFSALFIQQLLIFIQELLSSVDMSTRIIDRMLTGGLLHDTGRGYIKHQLYSFLDNGESLTGYGLFGCYQLFGKFPHDYILDFFFTFGYAVGGALLFLTTYIICKAHIICHNSYERGFILLLVCVSILKMFFSSTFVEDNMYFTLIGFCTSILIRHHYAKQQITHSMSEDNVLSNPKQRIF